MGVEPLDVLDKMRLALVDGMECRLGGGTRPLVRTSCVRSARISLLIRANASTDIPPDAFLNGCRHD